MCDQTELSYGDGDVVWVKIGPIWWPGVVKDVEKEGKEQEVLGGLRTKPIATVQFFDEDKYEFVKNLENIYHYNCRKKDEFIKKGLDKFRTGAKHMAKFPEDVTHAETLVKGDVNIVNHPKFAPAQKSSYSDMFATPKKKTKKAEIALKTKFLPLKKRHSAPTPYRSVAHNRSLSSASPSQTPGLYSCCFCDFSANFIVSICSHVAAVHSSTRVSYGPTDASPALPRTELKRPRLSLPTTGPKKKGRPAKPKTPQVTGKVETEKVTNITKTPVKKTAKLTTVQPDRPPAKKKRFTDALLADWSEEDTKDDVLDEETDLNENVSSQDVSKEKIEVKAEDAPLNNSGSGSGESAIAGAGSSEASEGALDGDKKEASCFDFDEEEDCFVGMSDANTYGRKIPRVIPVKDKTDLGMDLEFEELFKRKPEDEAGEGEEEDDEENKKGGEEPEPIAKKRRGRPPQIAQKKKAVEVKGTLAATRERRPGARKSYHKAVIETVQDPDAPVDADADEDAAPDVIGDVLADANEDSLADANVGDADAVADVEEEEPAKPSRRKQNLKRATLLEELDDLLSQPKKKKLYDGESTLNTDVLKKIGLTGESEASLKQKPVVVRASYSPRKKNVALETASEARPGESDDLAAQVESLLAETAAPVFTPAPLAVSSSATDEEVEGMVEYLEDEPEPVPPSPVKAPPSPVKKWKEDIRVALEKKSIIPQWKQGIQDALKANKPKDVEVKAPEPAPANIMKKLPSQTIVQQKGNTYYIVKPQTRPKILGQPATQQVMLVSNTRGGPQRVKLMGKPAAGQSATQATPTVVQLISDGKGGMKKVAMSKKVIQLGAKNSPQKYVLSGSGRDGLHVIENYNGTGKTVIVKEVGSVVGTGSGSQTLYGVRKKPASAGGVGGGEQTQCLIKRMGADGKYTIQTVKGVRRAAADTVYASPAPQTSYSTHQRPTLFFKTTEQPIQLPLPEPEPEPVAEPVIVQQELTVPAVAVGGTQQMIAMPVGPDGQQTYMVVTVDESGVVQTVDGSLLSSYVQPDVSARLYDPAEHVTPVYASSGQDILAEALANTNVLESEMPLTSLMIPSMQDASPLLLPSGVMPDAGFINSVVQETSINLQKPIMTAAEVPSSVVPDTSGLEPPPLPPTPTEEDVMEDVMEDSEGGLMIAEQDGAADHGQDAGQEAVQEQGQVELQPGAQSDFFIDDSQEAVEEVNSFESMPLLNEESAASEEPIGDQHFPAQGGGIDAIDAGQAVRTELIGDLHYAPQGAPVESEYLPTSTNPDLEQSQEGQDEQLTYPEEGEEGKAAQEGEAPSSMPFVAEEGTVVDASQNPSRENEVSSTTADIAVLRL